MATHRIQLSTSECETIFRALRAYAPSYNEEHMQYISAFNKINRILILANAKLTVTGKPLMEHSQNRALDDEDYQRITGQAFQPVCNGSMARMDFLTNKAISGETLTKDEEQELLVLNGWA
jgi:hypothetical protein